MQKETGSMGDGALRIFRKLWITFLQNKYSDVTESGHVGNICVIVGIFHFLDCNTETNKTVIN